jgi:hypothetical protein
MVMCGVITNVMGVNMGDYKEADADILSLVAAETVAITMVRAIIQAETMGYMTAVRI